MIPVRKFEKNILIKMDLGNKYLKFKSKFKRQQEIATIPKNELIKIFKQLGYNVRYGNGGHYSFYKEYKNYAFECHFHITKNSVFTYINLFKNDVLDIESNLSHFSYMLNFLPYDAELAKEVSNTFGINSVNEMKEYLIGLISLFKEFTYEYIKEIESGGVPE